MTTTNVIWIRLYYLPSLGLRTTVFGTIDLHLKVCAGVSKTSLDVLLLDTKVKNVDEIVLRAM